MTSLDIARSATTFYNSVRTDSPQSPSHEPSSDATVVSRPMLSWLDALAQHTGAHIVEQRVEEWLNDAQTPASDAAHVAIPHVQQRGFLSYTDSPVYISPNQITIFGVGASDAYNGCALFINNGIFYTLEGPALIGLARQAYTEQSGPHPAHPVDIASAYLPVGPIGGNGGRFQFEADGWAEYPTYTGRVELRYTNTGVGLGVVEVGATAFDGQVRGKGVYHVRYVR